MLSGMAWQTYLACRSVGADIHRLRQFEVLPGAEARHRLAALLLRQIQYFGARADALPEWREAARIREPLQLWKLWPSLPIIGKDALRTRFHPDALERLGVRGCRLSTGGSTGQPTAFLHDRRMLRSGRATRLYSRLQLGWTPGTPTLCVWGSERDIGRRYTWRHRISGWLRNETLVGGYRLTARTVDAVQRYLERHQRVAIFGFSSMLEFVARQLQARGGVRPGAVSVGWNGGEMLFADQVRLFRETFHAPLLNCYGGRELSAMAYQRETKGPIFVARPLLFLEIVDHAGHPVSPGECGRLIWTSTDCRGTPFLRYDIGDLGCSGAEDESGVRALRELQGRSAGLLALPGGRTIQCIYWNHVFKEFQEVEQFQVVLRQETILLRLRGTRLAAAREQALRAMLRNLLGEMPVGIDWVEQIPLTSQGKLVQVVREP